MKLLRAEGLDRRILFLKYVHRPIETLLTFLLPAALLADFFYPPASRLIDPWFRFLMWFYIPSAFVARAAVRSLDGQVSRPPGSFVRRILSALYSRKSFERVFAPTLADMQLEYFEALSEGKPWKARWVLVRDHMALLSACLLRGLFGLLKVALEIWKAASKATRSREAAPGWKYKSRNWRRPVARPAAHTPGWPPTRPRHGSLNHYQPAHGARGQPRRAHQPPSGVGLALHESRSCGSSLRSEPA